MVLVEMLIRLKC